MKQILVTGANGFIGKNLIAELYNRGYENIYKITRETKNDELIKYCSKADFVFHLAGVNRPKDEKEFMEGNYGFTSKLINHLKEQNNPCPMLISSSTQAELDNPYGKSKKAGEELIAKYGKDTNVETYIFRLPNVFGKWCKPNYNSAIATFCYNVARDLPINVNDENPLLNLVYIDDVVNEFINVLEGKVASNQNLYKIPTVYSKPLNEIVDLIKSFRNSREDKSVPYLADGFTKSLYSTYLSYLPEDDFGYKLKQNIDHRGSFTEFIKTQDRGQVSVNVSKPGITKGNHWHHTKNEKFLVVSGKGVIRFRKFNTDKVIEYFVSGDQLKVIDIPVGYTHNIENLGETDMVTIMWANEQFDPNSPDTYYAEV